MLRGKIRSARETCEHVDSVSISSTGLTRSICSDCGYVSFETVIELTAPVSREMFARDIDLAAAR